MTNNVSEDELHDLGQTVAQVFSGVCFFGLALWLIVINGTKLSFTQHASLEKRLQVVAGINTFVALFSAFFNFFQLTEVDNMMIDRTGSDNMSFDLARPVEWIFTCPLMQLNLVLLGGSQIPDYRRNLMPALSATVLLCGTASTLTTNDLRWIWYVIGIMFCSVMFYFNALQISEHSNGVEGLLNGDSEFRRASTILICTWFPFPIWYFISPEGFGIVDNVVLVHIGWAFLNICAKFMFIFYIQRVKDNYCNRLKVKREMYGVTNGGAQGADREQGELAAMVMETMTFLGCGHHSDRFMRLLENADVRTFEKIEAMDRSSAAELQLPWDFIVALQKRLKVWKLELQDTAEIEMNKGETYYNEKNGPMKQDTHREHMNFSNPFGPSGMQAAPMLVAWGGRVPLVDEHNAYEDPQAPDPYSKPTFGNDIETKSTRSGATVGTLGYQNKNGSPTMVVMPIDPVEQKEKAQRVEDISNKLDIMMHMFETRFAAAEASIESTSAFMKKVDSRMGAMADTMAESLSGLAQSQQPVQVQAEESNSSQVVVMLTDCLDKITQQSGKGMESVERAMRNEVNMVARQVDDLCKSVDNFSEKTSANVAEIRRMNMLTLDTVTMAADPMKAGMAPELVGRLEAGLQMNTDLGPIMDKMSQRMNEIEDGMARKVESVMFTLLQAQQIGASGSIGQTTSPGATFSAASPSPVEPLPPFVGSAPREQDLQQDRSRDLGQSRGDSISSGRPNSGDSGLRGAGQGQSARSQRPRPDSAISLRTQGSMDDIENYRAV